ncbi:hypothetical protein [Dyella telluris]|uniref:Uncharacterized protein n=1 Tax=Dyella telluris TaxID=2763498 RepID=A0A7G8Q4Q5_9GAMM|nr:hypothetical protein [Dyella telluris]QNK01763.1 hypothetical protein H8F01_00855 [Dyella telluris]
MKRLKRLESGKYTLERRQVLEQFESLCERCGNVECSIRGILTRLEENKVGAKLGLLECESFLVRIEFRDPAGLHGDFNTFRVGAAWGARVVEGQTVALSMAGGEEIGRAVVKQVHTGSFAAMNEKFGVDNHLSIAAAVEGEDLDLEEVMRKNYGPHRFNRETTCTVIYMERIESGAGS